MSSTAGATVTGANCRDRIPDAIRELFGRPPAIDAGQGRAAVEHYLRHEFDVLGSGWLRVYYGMRAPGFLGRNDSDPDMTWARLVERMPPQTQREALRTMDLATAFVPEYEPIDWHIDIKSGHRSELRPAGELAYGTLEGVDLKVTADLSRGYPLPQLGLAWRATGDARYWHEAVAQMLDWLAANPAGMGPGWRATMNVAIRTVNWIAALGLLANGFDLARPAHREAWTLLQRSLLEHRRRIAEGLEFPEGHFHPNHYVANLVGLLLLSLCLNDIDLEAAAWQRLAWRELRLEIGRQIGPDGLDFEGGTAYHAFVLEMLAVGLLLAARASDQRTAGQQRAWLVRQLGEGSLFTLRSMFEVLHRLTPPSGLVPVIGDNDSGRLVCLESPPAGARDWRFLSCIGAALFEDAALLPASVRAEDGSAAAWLVDGPVPQAPAEEPGDAAFTAAGLYVLRGGGACALVSAGPIGTAGLGGHAHNDKLALTLEIDGREILVDPGVFVYTASKAERNAARSVFSHNTVAVDQQEQNRWLSSSLWWGCEEDTHCRCLCWHATPSRTLFVGEHRGYHRIQLPVTHRRTLELCKAQHRLSIKDEIVSRSALGRPALTWSFVLHPRCEVAVDQSIATIRHDGLVVRLEASQGDWTVDDGFFSPAYGQRDATKVLRQTFPVGIAEHAYTVSW